jgi:hypothetical protein
MGSKKMKEEDIMLFLFIGAVALVLTFGVYEVERIYYP